MGSYTRSMAAATESSSRPHSATSTTFSPFLDLPPELRDLIYTHLLCPASLTRRHTDPSTGEANAVRYYDFGDFVSLQLTSRLVARESLSVFRACNHFVRISTPWPEAREHVRHEARVPMICEDERAIAFDGWSMGVVIEAPMVHGLAMGGDDAGGGGGEVGLDGMMGRLDHSVFVVHVVDVVDFCRMWYYSDLSHTGLNSHLGLTLVLRQAWTKQQQKTKKSTHDNNAEAMDVEMDVDSRSLPRAVQKQFMEPFGRIKGLASVRVEGAFDAAIYDNMMSAMQVPYQTPEYCLDQATKRREEGEVALHKNNDYQKAIDLYFDAFEHLHIRCEGRRRNIYGDAWFVKTLESGTYTGQQGHLVRLVLRVQLVAGVVHAYLGLGDWEMAHHWGLRSIKLMREANGDEDGEHEDEPMLNFPGAESVGLIYLGTAIACRELKLRDEARRYAKVAAAYLPNNQVVLDLRQELQLRRIGGYGWI